ncbi:MAG: DsbA family protein [Pseudomonadota bacterium]
MTRIPFVSIAVVAICGAIGIWLAMPGDRESASLGTTDIGAPAESAPAFSANAQQAEDIDTSTIVEMSIGAADAPVEIIEYASFTCPHCQTFHKNVFPQLKAEFVDTGKVRFVHREVYFDRFGLWAGMVARCGGEERYFGIIDIIYEEQREWTQGQPTDVVEGLRRIGRTAGLTNDQLDACLSDGSKAQTLVAWYQENAEEHGVNSTPTFVIDGRTYRNMPYSEFVEIIEDKVGG